MGRQRGFARWRCLPFLGALTAEAALEVATQPAVTVQDIAASLTVDETAVQATEPQGGYLEVTYSSSMQPLVLLNVGGQPLKMVFDASSGNTIVFVKEKKACKPVTLEQCYSYIDAEKDKTLRVCKENNGGDPNCDTGPGSKYKCDTFLDSLSDAHTHDDALIIDGLEYDQKAVESLEQMSLTVQGENGKTYSWSSMPVRLLVQAMSIPTQHGSISLELFNEAGGLLGGSGPSLSCRNTTLWAEFLKSEGVNMFALDFHPPPSAKIRDNLPSRIVFNEINPVYAEDVIWSQPKQTGDIIDDGMHELLLYNVQVCGIDMLYNTSSNWLTVIDTSGPCLMLPPFLFDRLRTRIPLDCPFGPGERSNGRLCSPKRDSLSQLMPSLSFALEDMKDPVPRRLQLPLERLVFSGADGAELICIAREDTEAGKARADMMYSHIAFGSMVMSALYTAIDLNNHTVGLATKGNAVTESSEATCISSISCTGMQTYFPPQNLCEDPQCSVYLFMTMDDATKTCTWNRIVPFAFGVLLLTLVVLDLVGHRMYTQAVERASEFSQ